MPPKGKRTKPDSAVTADPTPKKPTAAAAASGGDLMLDELFAGGPGGEAWLPLLKPVIEAQPDAAAFIGPDRPSTLVPVRELTFQALKPNPPAKWKVVIFGEKPYPRIESATGISMFDNEFHDYEDSRFGAVRSMKCIMKSALMWKLGVPKATPIGDMRRLLKENKVVMPPEWFQAILTQGCLLINAGMTASSDDSVTAFGHATFWRPIVHAIVREILRAKSTADEADRGVVFAWWGAHAKTLESTVGSIAKEFPSVPVRHVWAANPAARNDAFCDTNSFTDINTALTELKMRPMDWLPSDGWRAKLDASAQGESARMGDFITETMELHKFFLDRLGGAADEPVDTLGPIDGIMTQPLVSLPEATKPLLKLLPDIATHVDRSVRFAKTKIGSTLPEAEIAALYLYTCEGSFYRQLNAKLREADRNKIKPYFLYLRLLVNALGHLKVESAPLWRGVKIDLSSNYPKGETVTWWSVSSCTCSKAVAERFLGSSGTRTLFEVRANSAVSIKEFSAFTGEDEFLLAPGTQLKVESVKKSTGLTTIQLRELATKLVK